MIHLRRNPTFDTVYWYFLPVAAFCALLLTAIALVAAGRNVGSDESYYLMMIRSGEPMMITKYNMYLQPIRNWDVPCFRYLALAVMAASSLIFAAGTNRFFKGSFTDGALLFFLNLAGPLLLVLPVNLTISYISMNLAVFNVSLGLMLWATAVKSRPASLAAAFTAGAAAIQLVFIQPVNLPFIGLLLLIPLLRKRFGLAAAALLLGIPAGLAGYFGFIQSLPDYLAAMQSDLAVQSRGNSFLIIWCYENFHALLLAACAGGVLALIALRSANPVITKGERAVLAAIGWLLALALAASYLGSVVFPNGWYQNSTALAAFAAAAVFLAAAQYAERDGYAPEAVMLILLLLPALASFGTDLPLQHRASFYAGWMLTAAALAIRRCRSRNLAAAGVAVVVIMTVLMTCQFFRHNICTHSRLSADRAAIPGTSLRVNPETAEQLAKLAAIRGNAKYLFSNDIQFWRFTLLGNFERPTRQFWPKPECLALDTLRPSDLILLEFPAKKLDQRRIAEIAERLGATSVRRTDLGGGLTAIQFPEAQP